MRAGRQCRSVALAGVPHPAASPGTNPAVHPHIPRGPPSPGAPHSPQGTPFSPGTLHGTPWQPLSPPLIPQGWMNTPEIPFSGSAAMQGGLLNSNNNNNYYYCYFKCILEFFIAFPSVGGWLRRWHCATREVLPRVWGVPPLHPSPHQVSKLNLGSGSLFGLFPVFLAPKDLFSHYLAAHRVTGNPKPGRIFSNSQPGRLD